VCRCACARQGKSKKEIIKKKEAILPIAMNTNGAVAASVKTWLSLYPDIMTSLCAFLDKTSILACAQICHQTRSDLLLDRRASNVYCKSAFHSLLTTHTRFIHGRISQPGKWYPECIHPPKHTFRGFHWKYHYQILSRHINNITQKRFHAEDIAALQREVSVLVRWDTHSYCADVYEIIFACATQPRVKFVPCCVIA